MTEPVRRPLRAAAVAAGLTVLGGGLYLTALSLTRAPRRASLHQVVVAGRWEDRELQVVVHDLVEPLEAGTVVAVCRRLASTPVSLSVGSGTTLGTTLGALARQVDADLVVRRAAAAPAPIATLACRSGRRDELTIGRPAR